MTGSKRENIRRRTLLKTGTALVLGCTAVPSAFAQSQLMLSDEVSVKLKNMHRTILEHFGRAPTPSDLVSIDLPSISENGYSVSVETEVQCDMTAKDFVKRIALFSSRNPVPFLAEFTLTPQSGRAHIQTRIRLGGTQTVHAVAEMSDGRLLTAQTETLVTIAACVIL